MTWKKTWKPKTQEEPEKKGTRGEDIYAGEDVEDARRYGVIRAGRVCELN